MIDDDYDDAMLDEIDALRAENAQLQEALEASTLCMTTTVSAIDDYNMDHNTYIHCWSLHELGKQIAANQIVLTQE
jgi:hypothetical protein